MTRARRGCLSVRLTAPDGYQASRASSVASGQTVYVCGSSAFADAATELVTAAGHPADRLRVERFGPTG